MITARNAVERKEKDDAKQPSQKNNNNNHDNHFAHNKLGLWFDGAEKRRSKPNQPHFVCMMCVCLYRICVSHFLS